MYGTDGFYEENSVIPPPSGRWYCRAKLAVARVTHICRVCEQDIGPGEKYWRNGSYRSLGVHEMCRRETIEEFVDRVIGRDPARENVQP